MNYQNLVSVLSLASADNTDLGFDNSCYHAQAHPIIIMQKVHLILYLLNNYCLVSTELDAL